MCTSCNETIFSSSSSSIHFYVSVTLEPIITRRWSCFVGGQVQEKYLPLFTFIAYYYVFGYYSWFTLSRARVQDHVCEEKCVWDNKKTMFLCLELKYRCTTHSIKESKCRQRGKYTNHVRKQNLIRKVTSLTSNWSLYEMSRKWSKDNSCILNGSETADLRLHEGVIKSDFNHNIYNYNFWFRT